VAGFLVRPEAKGHGTQRWVEGPLESGSRVVVVDDVCTTGASLFRAVEAAERSDCRVALVVSVLDRKEGGSDELRRRGYAFRCFLEATPEGEIVVAK
jgi:orotate phosphoribosyltransferase